jgi:hypothetical protein
VSDQPIAWRVDVSLLGQPSMVANFLKIILLSVGLVGGLLVFLSLVLGGWVTIAPILALIAVCAGIMTLLLLFVVLVFFRNRIAMAYVIDDDGARSLVEDRRARLGGKAAIAAGLLGGGAEVAGAGLLAQSSSSQEVAWRAVRSVAYSPRWRTVTLANAWRTVLVLYCLPENYEAVAARVAEEVAAHPQVATTSPLPGLLLRSGVMICGFAPLFFLPPALRVEPFLVWLGLCFGLAAVWFLPRFAWVVVGVLGGAAAQLILPAINDLPLRSLTSSVNGASLSSRLGRLTGDEWAIVASATLGAAVLLRLAAGLLNGTYASALAGDLSDMTIDRGSGQEGER